MIILSTGPGDFSKHAFASHGLLCTFLCHCCPVALRSRCICYPGMWAERVSEESWGLWCLNNLGALCSTKSCTFSLWALGFEVSPHLESCTASGVGSSLLLIAAASLFGRGRRVQKANVVPFGKDIFQVNNNR